MKVGTSRSSPLRMFTGVSSKNPRCSDILTNTNSDCLVLGSGSGAAGFALERPNPKNPRDFFGLGSSYLWTPHSPPPSCASGIGRVWLSAFSG